MAQGAITWKQEQSARLLGWGIRFFLAAALTASQTTGGYAPFALGSVAAAGAGGDGLAALLGTALGAGLFLDFADALPHLAAGLLILTAATAVRGTSIPEKPWFLPLSAGGISLCISGIYVLQALAPLNHLGPCLAAAGLAGASAWFFRPLLQPGREGDLNAALLFLGAALLLGFSQFEFLGLSLGRILLGVLLAYVAYDRGTVPGVSAGLGLGLVTDLCASTGGGLFTAAYGLAGLLTGRCQGGHRGQAALGYFAASVAAMLPASHQLGEVILAETLISSGLFLLLPARLFGGKRVKRPESGEALTQAGDRLRQRLNKAASALRELYDSMGRIPPNSAEENPAIVFDRAAERVCRGCALAELCWQREYTGTFNALNDATPFLLERGRALAKDFPSYFSTRCIHLPELLGAINGELSAFLLRRQYRRQMEETRRSARGQYAQLSDLLTATAAGLEETAPVMGRQPLCRVGAVLRAKEGELACGDTVDSFRREDGTWCLLLSDGMGSGEAARKESALTCRLLHQFLEAGIEPEAALKTLNTAMALRGAETGCFTTIDLITWTPATGEAAFFKYGAAPSYVKKGGIVRRITGGSLPVGLRGAAALPDVTRLRLEPGSFLVMISDGVADSNQDDWLQDLLAGWEGEDPQALAGDLLRESIKREKLQDDCGIQIFYRPETEPAKPV